MANQDIDRLLADTFTPSPDRRLRNRGTIGSPPPTPPLIAQWKEEEALASGNWFRRWASSQVAGYRLELIFGYLFVMAFGGAAIAAGIPVFQFTTPEGWTPIWGAAVIVGGLVAAAGATRAGEEPQTRVVRIFNRIELTGAILLSLSLGIYSATLLLIGNGVFTVERLESTDTATAVANLSRIAIGAGFAALAIHPVIRMIFLFFHPGKLVKPTGHIQHTDEETGVSETTVTDVDTSPTPIQKDSAA